MARGRVLLIVGNSVSLRPREAPPGSPVSSYPERLKEDLRPAGWTIEERIVSGATVKDIRPDAEAALRAVRPDAVVLQLGIVDCTPRPLSPRERDFLSRVKPGMVRRRIVEFIHDHRAAIIEWRGLIQHLELEPFREDFRDLAAHCVTVAKRVIVLPIFPASSAILARNPRLAAEIDKYNAAMHSAPGTSTPTAAEIFRGESIDSLCITPDSVHLNQQGHDLIAEHIDQWLLNAPVSDDRP